MLSTGLGSESPKHFKTGANLLVGGVSAVCRRPVPKPSPAYGFQPEGPLGNLHHPQSTRVKCAHPPNLPEAPTDWGGGAGGSGGFSLWGTWGTISSKPCELL